MNLAYVGICSKALVKGMLICSVLRISINLANCFSLKEHVDNVEQDVLMSPNPRRKA